MQHPQLTLGRKLLSKGLPSLTFQVLPEPTDAAAPRGPSEKRGAAEGSEEEPRQR